jgi:hypothetical protein
MNHVQEIIDSDHLLENIKRLIELNYDSVEECHSAIGKVHEDSFKNKLEEFKTDHSIQALELAELLKTQEDISSVMNMSLLKNLVTQGRIVLANFGGDKSLLKAIRSTEITLTNFYENVINSEDMTLDWWSVLEKGLLNGKRHIQWLDECLAKH